MLKSKGIKPVTYVGYTNNLIKRIRLHNLGKGAKFTRGRKWRLIYKEKFKSKKEWKHSINWTNKFWKVISC